MQYHKPRTGLSTHEVSNQPPPFGDINLLETDRALLSAVSTTPGGMDLTALAAFGARAGSFETFNHAYLANKHGPELKSFDRYGHRLDEVEFHPSYHALMKLGIDSGVCSAAWVGSDASHVRHAALFYMMAQADAGVCCPMSMTYAALPTLCTDPDVGAAWEAGIKVAQYDPRFIPSSDKTGVTIGMAMTEKQGGSDVRTNTTCAEKAEDGWRLFGHKWFCSAPMCDAFLTLANSDHGLTCFLVPRWTPDRERNAIHIMRLKDKLGDRSNASSEIEYHGALAWKLGEAGRGIRTIIDMVQHTRFDCVIGSAAGIRVSVAHALWHAHHRTAFQKKLIDQPTMQGVLADLALESEAAVATAFRIAKSFDHAGTDEAEAVFMRLATPIAKYRICKRQPGAVYEALECHGGAGYIEEAPLARYFRASPLNAVWEGSGNVIALDVVRGISREPDSLDLLLESFASARGANSLYDKHLDRLKNWQVPGALCETTARAFVTDMGLALQAFALSETSPDFVFDNFCAARLDAGERRDGYGTARIDARRLVERAFPRVEETL